LTANLFSFVIEDMAKKSSLFAGNEALPLLAAGIAVVFLIILGGGAGRTALKRAESGPSTIPTQLRKSDGVVIAYPLPGLAVNSEFTVKGVADTDERFLEVRLTDSQGEQVDASVVEPASYEQMKRSSVFSFEAPLSVFNATYPEDSEEMTIDVYEIFPGADTLSEKKLLSVPVTVQFEVTGL
jgi:hypothetical protein